MTIKDILEKRPFQKTIKVYTLKLLLEKNDLELKLTDKFSQNEYDYHKEMIDFGIQTIVPFMIHTMNGKLCLINCYDFLVLRNLSNDQTLSKLERMKANDFSINFIEIQTKKEISINKAFEILTKQK